MGLVAAVAFGVAAALLITAVPGLVDDGRPNWRPLPLLKPLRISVFACFDPSWLPLKTALACFDLTGLGTET
jgi:hypothetical protein